MGGGHHHPVIRHEQDALVAELRCGARPFFGRGGGALEVVVIGHQVVETQAREAERLEAAVFETGDGGRVRHVGVQHASGLRVRHVDSGVQGDRGELDLALAFELVARIIDRDQAARGDLGPVQAVGVDQETVLSSRHAQREVIADALVQLQPRGQAEGSGEVDAGRKNRVLGGHVGVLPWRLVRVRASPILAPPTQPSELYHP